MDNDRFIAIGLTHGGNIPYDDRTVIVYDDTTNKWQIFLDYGECLLYNMHPSISYDKPTNSIVFTASLQVHDDTAIIHQL